MTQHSCISLFFFSFGWLLQFESAMRAEGGLAGSARGLDAVTPACTLRGDTRHQEG